ncbi:MAG TPA: DoxX family membrane protein, partial [Spirochaetia bacterium]|nr:DoxX family membrane protein [Spirochaetia bacterium]
MEDTGKLILRLTTAGLILFHGISKIIHGITMIGGAVTAYHLPGFVAYGVYAGEVV